VELMRAYPVGVRVRNVRKQWSRTPTEIAA
jgi:hypothetical protein